MQGALQSLQDLQERASGAALRGVFFGLEDGLRKLEVPVTELVPRELVERSRGVIEAIVAECRFHCIDHSTESGEDPSIHDGEGSWSSTARSNVVVDGRRSIAYCHSDEAS